MQVENVTAETGALLGLVVRVRHMTASSLTHASRSSHDERIVTPHVVLPIYYAYRPKIRNRVLTSSALGP